MFVCFSTVKQELNTQTCLNGNADGAELNNNLEWIEWVPSEL